MTTDTLSTITKIRENTAFLAHAQHDFGNIIEQEKLNKMIETKEEENETLSRDLMQIYVSILRGETEDMCYKGALEKIVHAWLGISDRRASSETPDEQLWTTTLMKQYEVYSAARTLACAYTQSFIDSMEEAVVNVCAAKHKEAKAEWKRLVGLYVQALEAGVKDPCMGIIGSCVCA